MKNISILGSTGSIGKNTLDVVKRFSNEFKIVGLSANTNINLLKEQIEQFSPEIVAVMDEKSACKLKSVTTRATTKIVSGLNGLIEVATHPDIDILVNSMVGGVGLIPTFEAIKSSTNKKGKKKRLKRIALANKETLVMAGEIVMNSARENNIEILPIDSEHSAIYQCINNCKFNFTTNNEQHNEVKRIILTASGGPFRNFTKSQLQKVTVAQALKHPTWNMGNKITIDSATLMNKGLEVIEAHWLFGISPSNIDVVIHPQSIIHSMVEFIDGSIIAQMSIPDMRIPIQYALTYPKRFPANFVNTDFLEIGKLTFEKPDVEKFPCLKLAYNALEIGGTMPTVLNASNEVAVHQFLNNKISFLDIPKIIEETISQHTTIHNPSLDDIQKTDKDTRINTIELIKRRY